MEDGLRELKHSYPGQGADLGDRYGGSVRGKLPKDDPRRNPRSGGVSRQHNDDLIRDCAGAGVTGVVDVRRGTAAGAATMVLRLTRSRLA